MHLELLLGIEDVSMLGLGGHRLPGVGCWELRPWLSGELWVSGLPQIFLRQKAGVLGLESQQWQLLSTLGLFLAARAGPIGFSSPQACRLVLVPFLCVCLA